MDTTIQDEKTTNIKQKTNKTTSSKKEENNNKARTEFRKHAGTAQIRELDREKGNRTTIENTTTTYSATTTTTRLDLA